MRAPGLTPVRQFAKKMRWQVLRIQSTNCEQNVGRQTAVQCSNELQERIIPNDVSPKRNSVTPSPINFL